MKLALNQLLLPLILGAGLALTLLTLPGWWSQAAYAAGPRYVAPPPLGSDSGNNCLDSSTPCATVQHAVDQATPGEEIRVAAGTYTGVSSRASILLGDLVTQVVYISQPLTLRGGYSPADWTLSQPLSNPTVLDAGGQGRVFNLESDSPAIAIEVTIDGFSITNGLADGQADCWGGRGAGGGINGCAVTGTLINNQVYNNQGRRAGGGIALIGLAPVTLRNNRITTNSLTAEGNIGAGGGVALGVVDSRQQALVAGNLIRANQVTGTEAGQSVRGGGFFEIGNAVLTGNLIQANEVVALNGAQGRGGGVDFEGALAMTNTVIADNRITGLGEGAGMFMFGLADVWHLTLARNSGGDGAGLHLVTGTLALTNAIVASQTVGVSVNQASTAILNSVLWVDNQVANITGPGQITLTRQFTGNPAFLPDGYHLGAGSAASDRGIEAGVTVDIDGQPRSLTTPDLGADETTPVTHFLPLVLKD